MGLRIGQGIDFHRLGPDRELWLGGIKIPSEKGCIAHSDGDVLIHAICDALLGAASAGDIGTHFPDTSDEYHNIDSKILLGLTCDLIRNKGYEIVNIDSTLCLEEPRIAPFIKDMTGVLATCCKVSVDSISIKATTTEKMGFTGRGEGIIATAVALLENSKAV